MIPVLAAINAIDAAEKVATGAMALWKQMSASKAEAKEETSGPGNGFGEILASQGVTSGPSKASGGNGNAGANAAGGGRSSHVVDRLA